MVTIEQQQIQRVGELLPWLSRSMFSAMKGFAERALVECPEFAQSTSLLKVLMLLNAKGLMKVGEIAVWLNVSPSTASEHLDRFVEAGLVERRVNPDDRRQVLVGLTERGGSVVQPCAEYFNERIHSALAQFDEQQLEIVARAMAALAESFENDSRFGPGCPLDGN